MANVSVYIIAGQSNCGRSRFSELSGPLQIEYGGPITGVSIYNSISNINSFQTLQAGSNTLLINAINSDEMGPEVSLAKALADGAQTPAYIIKCGVGNTDLATYWKPGGAGEQLLKRDCDKAFQLILGESNTPVIKAFIWMQGENDATVEAWADDYRANLFNMFDDFRIWLNNKSIIYGTTINTNYVKVIGRINGVNDNPPEIYRETVRQAEAEFCGDAFNNAVLIDTDGYPFRDGVHYSAAGQITFGLDIFTALEAAEPVIPDNNLFGGRPNIGIAHQTGLFDDAGITSINTSIIYLVDDQLKSFVPGREINGITGFVTGKGYYIVPMVDFYSPYLIPPIPAD